MALIAATTRGVGRRLWGALSARRPPWLLLELSEIEVQQEGHDLLERFGSWSFFVPDPAHKNFLRYVQELAQLGHAAQHLGGPGDRASVRGQFSA